MFIVLTCNQHLVHMKHDEYNECHFQQRRVTRVRWWLFCEVCCGVNVYVVLVVCQIYPPPINSILNSLYFSIWFWLSNALVINVEWLIFITLVLICEYLSLICSLEDRYKSKELVYCVEMLNLPDIAIGLHELFEDRWCVSELDLHKFM